MSRDPAHDEGVLIVHFAHKETPASRAVLRGRESLGREADRRAAPVGEVDEKSVLHLKWIEYLPAAEPIEGLSRDPLYARAEHHVSDVRVGLDLPRSARQRLLGRPGQAVSAPSRRRGKTARRDLALSEDTEKVRLPGWEPRTVGQEMAQSDGGFFAPAVFGQNVTHGPVEGETLPAREDHEGRGGRHRLR